MSGLFGNRATAAIDHRGFQDGLVIANVYVAGQNITPTDNAHYDQYLIHNALRSTASRLSQIDASWRQSHQVSGESLAHTFNGLWESDQWSEYDVFDWQPCTGSFRCAVIPQGNELQLCCARHDSPMAIFAVAIDPRRVADNLLDARRHIVDTSPNPHLVLDPKRQGTSDQTDCQTNPKSAT